MDFCADFKYLNDKNHVFVEIEYWDLREMISENKTGYVIIGGPWSPRTQAVIKESNEIFKRENVEKVYFYNPRTINVFKEEEDLRDCLSLESKLDYYYLVEKLGIKNKENKLVENTLIQKMYVPLFVSLKRGKCTDYFNANYLKDPYIHKPNDIEDKTLEFDERLTKLIKSQK
ncbi:MAG: hypothetical protein K6E20_02745 [Acholeplasmatales bacterium]|nr:hypothetical protein [Acholeplasmatales bacterium]